jgi:rhodanese-related sulfurtransferase
MRFILIAICLAAVVVSLFIVRRIKRTSDRRDIELHSITAEALHSLLASNREVLLYDVRQPLDLLADSEIIHGATRIPPKELLENSQLIPKDKDLVVYCTCPGEETSRKVVHIAEEMHFTRVRFLKGGLAGWKAKGYPVDPYEESFHLDANT